jgi:hypothetical protein
VIRWHSLRRLAAAPALLLALVLPASATGSFDADLWDALLAAHTREVADAAGVCVDYGALRGEPRWPALLASLAGADLRRIPRRASPSGSTPTTCSPSTSC